MRRGRHIPVGVADFFRENFVWVAILAIIVLGVCHDRDCDAQVLPAANGANWTTLDAFSALPTATKSVEFTLATCTGFGPLEKFTVTPDGAAKGSPTICSGAFGIVASPVGVTSEALLIYDDGKGTHRSFSVEPINAKRSARFSPIWNDADTGTFVNVFAPPAFLPTKLTLWLYGPTGGDAIAEEFCDATPGTWTQCTVKTPLAIGSLSYSIGQLGIGADAPAVYAFVTRSRRDGDNAKVIYGN